jgi:glycosyltransferase involved in cell wall biosynthesis
MAVGVPVIASDVGDVSLLLGAAGITVPAKDVDAVARECVRLLTDTGLRKRLGKTASERARLFDSTTMVHRYEALFAGALDGTPPIAAVATVD